tara:strand:- start:1741 stop:2727 length:987 start_codon:yes stop_codon:yes gene_type:complete
MRNEERFLSMLEYTRPHEGKSEAEYLERFILPNCDWVDGGGNHIKIIGQSNPRILFSSHTDTVHRHDGKQKLFVDGNNGCIFSDSTCLGGDDTVGNYLMLSMIENEISGLYIFHRGEERGGVGSMFIANETPQLLNNIEIAIGLDRKGTDDVIQFQNCERCCSEQFASELATLMEITGGDEVGTFTDTANYTELISECTNISVAYWDQHSKNERCSPKQIGIIEERLLKANWDSLKAYGYEPEQKNNWYLSYGDYHSGISQTRTYSGDEYWDLHHLVTSEPYTIVDYLFEVLGVTVEEIYDDLRLTHDSLPRGNGGTRELEWDGHHEL